MAAFIPSGTFVQCADVVGGRSQVCRIRMLSVRTLGFAYLANFAKGVLSLTTVEDHHMGKVPATAGLQWL